MSRKFWGHEEESGKEVLVPLEEPSREEEKVRLEAEKEEFAETLHAVGMNKRRKNTQKLRRGTAQPLKLRPKILYQRREREMEGIQG